jgi:hypothetical protein
MSQINALFVPYSTFLLQKMKSTRIKKQEKNNFGVPSLELSRFNLMADMDFIQTLFLQSLTRILILQLDDNFQVPFDPFFKQASFFWEAWAVETVPDEHRTTTHIGKRQILRYYCTFV